MAPRTATPATPAPAETFNLSSFMTGNVLQQAAVSEFATVADILSSQNIQMDTVNIDIYDASGNSKAGTANTTIAAGDTVQILRSSNKSG